VLPVVLLILFAYAVSLDIRKVRIGVVVESPGPRPATRRGVRGDPFPT